MVPKKLKHKDFGQEERRKKGSVWDTDISEVFFYLFFFISKIELGLVTEYILSTRHKHKVNGIT